MKLIDSWCGNSSDMIGVRQKAYECKSFRYIIVSTSGGHEGAVGGSFNYEVHGTDLLKDLFTPTAIERGGEIIDTVNGERVERNELAKEYLMSLTEKERADLIDKVLLKYLSQE